MSQISKKVNKAVDINKYEVQQNKEISLHLEYIIIQHHKITHDRL